MIYLILRRLVTDHFRHNRHQRAERLKKLTFDYLADDLKLQTFAARIRAKDQRVLLSLAGGLMRGLKSAPRQKLIDLLNETIDLKAQVKALRKGSDAERAALCSQLAWANNSDLNNAFWHLLQDSSPDVVLAAANALIDNGQDLNLIDFVNTAETNGMLSHRGIRQLVRRVASEHVDSLCKLLHHSNATVIAIAADALGRIRETKGLASLAHLAEHHPDADVRSPCLRALGLIGHPDAAWAVAVGLEDKNWPVRAQAATAAGRIGLKDLIPSLSKALSDPEWWVRFRAAQSLLQLGATGNDVLMKARNSADLKTAEIADLVFMEAQS